jgi:hypothetical protein
VDYINSDKNLTFVQIHNLKFKKLSSVSTNSMLANKTKKWVEQKSKPPVPGFFHNAPKLFSFRLGFLLRVAANTFPGPSLNFNSGVVQLFWELTLAESQKQIISSLRLSKFHNRNLPRYKSATLKCILSFFTYLLVCM